MEIKAEIVDKNTINVDLGEWRITLEAENHRNIGNLSGTFVFEPINEPPLRGSTYSPGRTTSLLIRRKSIGTCYQ